MKYCIVAILIMVLGFSHGLAQEKDPKAQALEEKREELTDREFVDSYSNAIMMDGVVWNRLPETEKGFYLIGFEDGIMAVLVHFVPDEKKKRQIYSILPMSVKNAPALSGIVQKVDEFYADEKNVTIPIYYALLIIRNRLSGSDEEKIERYIDYLRDSEGKKLEEAVQGEEKIKAAAEETAEATVEETVEEPVEEKAEAIADKSEGKQ
jgi:hypothetical protein